jgi:hypothetical protein
MTEDEIAVKFNALSEEVVGAEGCERIRELVMELETAQTVSPLMQAMSACLTSA